MEKAENISKTTKNAPWIEFGANVLDSGSPEEILREAGLDWDVEKKPLKFEHQEDNKILLKKVEPQALVRTSDHKVLSIVSPDWTPMQNTKAFEFFTEFVRPGNMKMVAAGGCWFAAGR